APVARRLRQLCPPVARRTAPGRATAVHVLYPGTRRGGATRTAHGTARRSATLATRPGRARHRLFWPHAQPLWQKGRTFPRATDAAGSGTRAPATPWRRARHPARHAATG